MDAYSNRGLTNAWYAVVLTFLEEILRFLWRKLSVPLALVLVCLVWVFQRASDVKFTPRYFTEVTVSMGTP